MVKEIEALGGVAVADVNSVATPEGGAAIVDTAVENFGRVDIVINNAGILRDKTFAKLEHEDLDAVLEVHLKGAFHVSQPAARMSRTGTSGQSSESHQRSPQGAEPLVVLRDTRMISAQDVDLECACAGAARVPALLQGGYCGRRIPACLNARSM